MPLQSWAAFYGAVTASRMDELVQNLAVAHPKNPKHLQQQLRRAAREALQPKKRGIISDPARFRAYMERMGVVVKDASTEAES